MTWGPDDRRYHRCLDLRLIKGLGAGLSLLIDDKGVVAKIDNNGCPHFRQALKDRARHIKPFQPMKWAQVSSEGLPSPFIGLLE